MKKPCLCQHSAAYHIVTGCMLCDCKRYDQPLTKRFIALFFTMILSFVVAENIEFFLNQVYNIFNIK